MDRGLFSAREIYASLASTYKRKIMEYDEITIIRWCSDVVAILLTDERATKEMVADMGMPVNLQHALPDGLVQLIRVYATDTKALIPYSHQSEYVCFEPKYEFTNISFHFRQLMIEDGYPLIPRGFEKACEAYCLYQMYHEDYLDGRIDGQRWQDISNTKDWEIEAASRAWDSINDNEVQAINKIIANTGYKKFVR